MSWLAALPACTVPVAVALVLAAESGLLIGLVLPGSSLVIGTGVLAGAGLVSMPVAALTAAAATVGGAALGHRRATRQSPDALLPTGGRISRLLPGRVRCLVERSASPWAEAVARRPVRMAAAAQFATGSRTLAPRIAARAGVPLPTMLRGTLPAALLWSWGLVALGAAAGAAAPRLNGMAAAAGLPVVIVATWLLVRRRGRAAAAPRTRRTPARGGLRWWLPALAASTGVVSVTAVAVLGCCVTDASASESPHPGSPSSATDAARATAPHPVDQDRILTEVEAAAEVSSGSIAVVVLDADGRSVVTGPDANSPIHSASLVKVFVVAQLLALDAAGSLSLTEDDADLMQRAIVSSDDDAMNALWSRHEGAQLVLDIAATMRLTGTSPPSAAGQWGQTTTTAADVATFQAAVEDVLDPEDATTLLGWMRSTTATAADGFDQRFGLLAQGAGGAAAKQGWMCCIDGRRQLHSAGVLGDGRFLVLLGDFPASTSWAQPATALDTAATATRTGTAAID
ncbi:membrane protein DedA with SNARE-associated domain [Blastococcus colisei]|uniref:Membrane protein DedA with SNARE-associated domain n=1 Tax=Blastococcus colisei TaxID=1564162 RepID=A0A543PEJ6_9ACTN|nr:serine hydrolase [Blastococcus colisei]TQN42493.1 membrane protein DedA with SNARE-associated domain [Blastococcus colisei]